jgi:hypothetical protein
MSHIVLTQEQAQVVTQASESVEVRDLEGRTLAFLTVLSPEDAAAVLRYKETRHLPKRSVSSAQVQNMLRRLEEIARTEGIDEAKREELCRRIRAGEEI